MKTGMFSDYDLKQLIAPLVVEQVLSMLVGMVDTVMVSHAGEAAISGVALDEKNAASIRMRDVLRWQGDMIRRILRIGVPGGIENGLFSLGKVLVVSIISLFGTTQIAANGIANSIDMISIIVVNAMNLAIVTVVGQCVGAKEYEQAAYYTGKLMKTSYITTAVLGILVCLCLPVIRLFYDVSDETWQLTCILVVMHNAFAAALHPTSFNLSNTLRAAGDVKYTMYSGIGSMIVFRLGSAVLFAIRLNLGVIGVWMAMGMDWLARSVAFYARYRSGKWKQFRAI